MTKIGYGISCAVLAAGLAAGYFWWRSAMSPAPTTGPTEMASTQAPSPPPEPAGPAEPAVRYPIEVPIAASSPQGEVTPPATTPELQLENGLNELLGSATVLRWLQLDDFARRLVATVDNLARTHAAARLWPVNPTPGRFSVRESPDGQVLDASNHARYTPFVGLVERMDSRRAVALYRRLYPLFQRTYEELGYPGQHFNDRLVDVIDHLMATPEPAEPLRVQLVEVKGSLPSLRPWVRYEFADPAHEARSAGQKLLMRMGLDHQRALKAKLNEVRGLVTHPAAGGG